MKIIFSESANLVSFSPLYPHSPRPSPHTLHTRDITKRHATAITSFLDLSPPSPVPPLFLLSLISFAARYTRFYFVYAAPGLAPRRVASSTGDGGAEASFVSTISCHISHRNRIRARAIVDRISRAAARSKCLASALSFACFPGSISCSY